MTIRSLGIRVALIAAPLTLAVPNGADAQAWGYRPYPPPGMMYAPRMMPVPAGPVVPIPPVLLVPARPFFVPVPPPPPPPIPVYAPQWAPMPQAATMPVPGSLQNGAGSYRAGDTQNLFGPNGEGRKVIKNNVVGPLEDLSKRDIGSSDQSVWRKAGLPEIKF